MLPLIRIPIKLQLPTFPFFQNLLSSFFYLLYPVQAALFRNKPRLHCYRSWNFIIADWNEVILSLKVLVSFPFDALPLDWKVCLSSFASFQKRAESNQNQSCPKNIRRLCLKAGHVGLDLADLTASHTHVWAAVISVLLGLTQRGQLSL